jgi:hypothetical protein
VTAGIALHLQPYDDAIDSTTYDMNCIVIFLSMFVALVIIITANSAQSQSHAAVHIALQAIIMSVATGQMLLVGK